MSSSTLGCGLTRFNPLHIYMGDPYDFMLTKKCLFMGNNYSLLSQSTDEVQWVTQPFRARICAR